MLLPSQVLACDWCKGRACGVGSVISIELGLGGYDCATRGLVKGLAGVRGGVILTVGRRGGGCNQLLVSPLVCLFCENLLFAVQLRVLTEALGRLKAETVHMEFG